MELDAENSILVNTSLLSLKAVVSRWVVIGISGWELSWITALTDARLTLYLTWSYVGHDVGIVIEGK